MRRWSMVLLAIASVAVSNAAGLKWVTDYSAAKKLGVSSGKLLMVDFYTDWCGWCKKLDQDTYPAPAVVKEAANFVPVKLDAEKGGKDVATKYGVTGFPTILILDPKSGEVVWKIVGYSPAPEFASQLHKAATIRQDLKKYKERVAKDPKDVKALISLAGSYASTGKLDESVATIKKAEALNPAPSAVLFDAYNAIGDAYQNSNQLQEATTYFAKAIHDGFPQQAAYARISEAVCFATLNQKDKAIAALKDLVAMGKDAGEYATQGQQMLDQLQKGN